MTECHQQLWAEKTGKSTAAPKLCSLPPTTEAFEQNVYRAHFQVSQWYSALSRDPPHLSVLNYEWEVDDANKCLIPRNVAEGVPYAPEKILKLAVIGQHTPAFPLLCSPDTVICVARVMVNLKVTCVLYPGNGLYSPSWPPREIPTTQPDPAKGYSGAWERN
ncbi:hypothetical protein E2C01_040421 [Portunus trituberculatus]|uniref:Uncharacterized protein n=1 Tax=Portunus trituberculatus TaxID=210409 RepID=A0A5B7FMH1_PORTR|nr:hypothetical protein [Portunus trituberculatus]